MSGNSSKFRARTIVAWIVANAVAFGFLSLIRNGNLYMVALITPNSPVLWERVISELWAIFPFILLPGGFAIAVAQSVALSVARSKVVVSWFVPTFIGVILGASADMILVPILGNIVYNGGNTRNTGWEPIFVHLPPDIVLGIIMGFCQWFIIRRWKQRGATWILRCAV